MKLTKNEKRALKLMLENGKVSDSYIAAKLRISSQAVGKIRSKLEGTIIDSYHVKLNYSRLGVQTFAIAFAKLTSEGLDTGNLEVEQKILKEPHILSAYRLPGGNHTHILFYGFRDVNELDSYFHASKKKQELHNLIEVQQLHTFSHNSLIKNSPEQLFAKAIDEFGEKEGGFKIKDNNFKGEFQDE